MTLFSENIQICRGVPYDTNLNEEKTVNMTSPGYPNVYLDILPVLCTWTIYMENLRSTVRIRFIDFIGPNWLYMGVSVPYLKASGGQKSISFFPWSNKPAGMTIGLSQQIIFGLYQAGDGYLQSTGYRYFEALFWIKVTTSQYKGKKPL